MKVFMVTFCYSFDKFKGWLKLAGSKKKMKKYIYIVAAFVLFLPIDGSSQIRKSKPTPAAKPAVSNTDAKFPGYSFEITIDKDKTVLIEVLTGYEQQNLDNGQLNKALSEYLSMQSRKPVGPKITIRPDESLDLKTVLDVVKAVRVSDSADVSIEMGNGESIGVPVDPRFIRVHDVRPNPLFLLAVLDEKKGITLNNEEYGNLADPSRLKVRLREIFNARENNGVFRPGSNEVEKTVNVKMPSTAKFTDLINFVKALEYVGAGPLVLQVDKDDI